MADNTTYTPGSGATIAADDIGGVLVQRVKVQHGADGSGTDVSSDSPLPVDPAGAGDVVEALTDGRKTVSSAGTAVALATSTSCKWVLVTALAGNTDKIWIGGSGVSGVSGSEKGTPLSAGDSVTIPVDDLATVFIDALVDDEGVTYTAGS